MSLFQFELKRIEDIEPWGGPENPSLSWFALTDGAFRINVGSQTLLEYTPEILAHWGCSTPYPDYQVAAFGRDILGSLTHAISPVPARIERLVRRWPLLEALDAGSRELPDAGSDCHYAAWRWLGERTPWLSYLQASPRISYVRVGDLVEIHWNNSALLIDDLKVWTASRGMYTLPAEDFVQECRSFARRLLEAMNARLTELESAATRPRASVNMAGLREQHEGWRVELDGYLQHEADPDVPWSETEAALQSLATRLGLDLPWGNGSVS